MSFTGFSIGFPLCQMLLVDEIDHKTSRAAINLAAFELHPDLWQHITQDGSRFVTGVGTAVEVEPHIITVLAQESGHALVDLVNRQFTFEIQSFVTEHRFNHLKY